MHHYIIYMIICPINSTSITANIWSRYSCMKLPINYATGMIKMNYCRRNNSINEEKFREYANQSLNTFHLNHMWMWNRDKTVQIPWQLMVIMTMMSVMLMRMYASFFPSSSSGCISIRFNYFNNLRCYYSHSHSRRESWI